jgi:hypothetical protein
MPLCIFIVFFYNILNEHNLNVNPFSMKIRKVAYLIFAKKVPFSFHAKGINRQIMTNNNRIAGIKKGLTV